MRLLKSLVGKLSEPRTALMPYDKRKSGRPDFIIIGAQKSGTTSLYHYLCQHPQIREATRKQVHFFDGGVVRGVDNFRKGLRWYAEHFPDRKKMSNNSITGEATPLYIYDPRVPQRVHSMLPEVKLIAILRNPVERAISHFFHERRQHRESLSIAEAMNREDERLADDIQAQNFSGEAFRHFSYKGRGRYAEQLKRFYDLFPRENILAINSENLFENSETLLSQVFSFLNVDSGFDVTDLSPRNVARNRESVNDTVSGQLEEYFKGENEKLYRLIGKRFHW